MDRAIETFEVGHLTVRIYQDECPDSPRGWDNVGHIVYCSNRYVLGDEKIPAEQIKELMESEHIIWLPVYAYIHSGVCLKTAPFIGHSHFAWDSGMSGIIYVGKQVALEKYGFTSEAQVREALAAEIEVFSQYLAGDVYGFTISRKCHCCGQDEVEESVWGFYGYNYCVKEAKDMAEAMAEDMADSKVFQVQVQEG